ncbi:hypothetical protein MHZ36_12410 [Staphylococcus sp. ACRSN]|uniref:hypothetical protein n=1 Tax=Staphylococcus sp. ACRSN TaxID=2918214 RepID=UPI001EF2C43B|nr:hypothetical protein [Staphylococcus sp. ACRSN]MCG7340091.1 hypothetical protein [Staphylococcus sp. ACRSN]
MLENNDLFNTPYQSPQGKQNGIRKMMTDNDEYESLGTIKSKFIFPIIILIVIISTISLIYFL